MVDVCFLVDLVARFLTAYHDDHADRMVCEPMQIARNYSRGLLVFDLIAAVPLTIVSFFFFRGRGGQGARCGRRFMLLRFRRCRRRTCQVGWLRWSAGTTNGCSLVSFGFVARVENFVRFVSPVFLSRVGGVLCPHHRTIVSHERYRPLCTYTSGDGACIIPALCKLDRSRRFGVVTSLWVGSLTHLCFAACPVCLRRCWACTRSASPTR